MGVKITKDNIDEYITSYIDGEINDPSLEKEINDILSKDDTLLKKYLSETLTKKLIRSRLQPQEVPDNVSARIMNSIDNLITSSINSGARPQTHPVSESRSFTEYMKRIITASVRIGRIPVPRYAFGIVIVMLIIAVGLLVNKKSRGQLNPYIANGTEKSIMVQAVNNFHKFLNGEMKPQVSSNSENDVKKYLKDNLDYEVYVPCVENCEVIGAICDEYNGQKRAHILYRTGDDVFYICETPSKSLNHKCMEIPDPVHNEIISKKFYMCDKIDMDNDCTMLLWYTGNLVCASVSTMPKQKMYAAFTNFK